ncbi:MAG: hypothetical protein Q8L98_00555 [Chlamydiales bacterium]|nr:hypothetical protein [Chlamydiales bacterium]
MIQKYGLYIIWVMSCLGTLGGLYLGQPSTLDWCQRVCLFPLVFIAGIAAWRGFLAIATYLIPQALFGFACASYQVLLFKMPETFSSIYSEPIRHPTVNFIFAGMFFSILVLSVYLSKKQTIVY